MMSQEAGEVFGLVKIYTEQHIKLIKLDLAGRFSKATSGLTLLVVAFILIMFILLLLSVSVGLYLGGIWESYPLAFLAITGFYILVALVLIVFRKPLILNPILATVINEMMDEDEK